MKDYLGETPHDTAIGPFSDFKPIDWALYFIGRYGQIDGDHHKQWVLDQTARILNDTPVLVSVARWGNESSGSFEFRVRTGEPSRKYLQWVDSQRGVQTVENGELSYEYGYDEGIPP